ILDPNPESRDALRRALSSLGCPVRSFSESAEAVRAMPEFSPDLVLAALDAPGAMELLEEARRAPGRTALALVDERELERGVAALPAGAHDFLWRPVSVARVAQLVAAACARVVRETTTEELRLRLARVEVRDALPGRSPRWIGALAALERA